MLDKVNATEHVYYYANGKSIQSDVRRSKCNITCVLCTIAPSENCFSMYDEILDVVKATEHVYYSAKRNSER